MAGIFHTYDVRGIVPTEINTTVAYRLGIAVARHFKTEKVGVGYDARVHSQELKHYFVLGLNKEGVQAYDVGLITTPQSYYAARFYPSVCITASHNPKEYNGFKVNARGPTAIGLGTGLEMIEEIYNTLNDVDVPQQDHEEKRIPADLTEEFASFVANKVHLKKRQTVVVDVSNGAAGPVIKRIAEIAGFDCHCINDIPDGTFPAHGPNPLAEGATQETASLVKAQHAVFGVVLDADADRAVFVDEKGRTLSADVCGAIVLKHILHKNGGEGVVVYDQTVSQLVDKAITEAGGEGIECPVGRTLMVQAMVQHQGIFGIERSSHFYFRDFFFQDSPSMMILMMLETLHHANKPLSELVDAIPHYEQWSDNVHIHDKSGFLHKFQETFTKGNVSKLDGVKVVYESSWIMARPSNTEPLLRFVIEARDKEQLEKLRARLSELIQEFT